MGAGNAGWGICYLRKMKSFFTRRVRFWSQAWSLSWALIPMLACGGRAGVEAEPVAVRLVQGTFHGFLELRSEEGRLLASGDSTQVVHGDRLTAHTVFSFKDGSIDDETTVFSQQGAFRLISDRHIQKGPFFPDAMDVSIDARSGEVTVHSTGKDGKEEVRAEHMNLPLDLANGMVPLVLENLRPDAGETRVSMVVAMPKPRLVKLAITNRGEESCSVGGVGRKAIHYEIKIELGGVAGVVAPLIGKAPPNIEVWIIGGPAPTFAREQGPIYPEGPMMTIQLASPVWPEAAKAGE